MNIEKTTSISLPSTKGKFTFQRSGETLQITVIDSDGVTHDSATLTEDDLRFLLKDCFPMTRKPRGPNTVKKQTNGKGKDKGARASA